MLFNRFFHVIYKYFHSNISGNTILLERIVCLIWNLQLTIARCLWPNINLKTKFKCLFLSWVFQKIHKQNLSKDYPDGLKKYFSGTFQEFFKEFTKTLYYTSCFTIQWNIFLYISTFCNSKHHSKFSKYSYC